MNDLVAEFRKRAVAHYAAAGPASVAGAIYDEAAALVETDPFYRFIRAAHGQRAVLEPMVKLYREQLASLEEVLATLPKED